MAPLAPPAALDAPFDAARAAGPVQGAGLRGGSASGTAGK
jgi:hypothetical protein